MVISHGGETKTLSEWAATLGIKSGTLYARIRKGYSLDVALSSVSMREKKTDWYKTHGVGGGRKRYEHITIVERALGKPLPNKSRVHHIDGDRTNNDRSNLLVCPSDAYHRLIHMRTSAFEQSGNANNRKCAHCHKWDAPENMRIYGTTAVHGECHNRYFRERRVRLGLLTGKRKSMSGVNNPSAKLTHNDVGAIRDSLNTGASISEVARQFGVSSTTIRDISIGKRWAHVE